MHPNDIIYLVLFLTSLILLNIEGRDEEGSK